MLATLVIGPGLVVNVGLKDHWPRSRPIDVPQFNGSEHFTAWWDPRGGCPKNCSFVCGGSVRRVLDAGAGRRLLHRPGGRSPMARRSCSARGVGALRLAFGAHFFSDIVFAGVIMFLLIWTAHGLLYRWRATPALRRRGRTGDRTDRVSAVSCRRTRFCSRIAAFLRQKGRRA